MLEEGIQKLTSICAAPVQAPSNEEPVASKGTTDADLAAMFEDDETEAEATEKQPESSEVEVIVKYVKGTLSMLYHSMTHLTSIRSCTNDRGSSRRRAQSPLSVISKINRIFTSK